jgi:hypothetical protein
MAVEGDRWHAVAAAALDAGDALKLEKLTRVNGALRGAFL